MKNWIIFYTNEDGDSCKGYECGQSAEEAESLFLHEHIRIKSVNEVLFLG